MKREGWENSHQKAKVFGRVGNLNWLQDKPAPADSFPTHVNANKAAHLHPQLQALLNGGKHFCGLALDQDNEDDKTEERIQGWVAQLKKEGF